MPRGDLKFSVDDAEVKALIAGAPKIANSEFTKALRAIGGNFMREFTRRRLSGRPGIKVNRRTARKVTKTKGAAGESSARRKVTGPNQIAVPRKARAMGFTGMVAPAQSLAGKAMEIRSGSPVTRAHEFGGTIQGNPFLYLPIRNASAARRAGVVLPRGKVKRGPRKGQAKVQPKVLRVRSVRMKARLGFRRLWSGYERTAVRRLHQAMDRIAQRVEAIARRRRAA